MKGRPKQGKAPVLILDGGPGVVGEATPLAKELSKTYSVFAPVLTSTSIEGQLEDLKLAVGGYGGLPAILIGWSWGAWLGFLFAAKYPSLVLKLILVGSGPFEQKYVRRIMTARERRLDNNEKIEMSLLLKALGNTAHRREDAVFLRLGELLDRADSHTPVAAKPAKISVWPEVYQGVWPQAEELRRSGKLLKLGKRISCPVVAIHGDYDPHPVEGVKDSLSKVIRNFGFVLLKNCGHKPWTERFAKDTFYGILNKELMLSDGEDITPRAPRAVRQRPARRTTRQSLRPAASRSR